ncbi:hypothetical protein [Pseudobacillus badius]|uniref:hypothetical protein n=1 Tax=Bacillus badius TaxID=1455 RepID=UPI0007B33B3E|nr:hypothetical protein [Bacillus badius]KZR57899.1 hypothetical protein A3781_19170 [Bacillus badius]
MKTNKFKVSSILYFKSGNSKKVDWVEERLGKKLTDSEGNESIVSLTLDEADDFFQGKFKDWKDNGTTIVRKNAKGETSVIPFSEIEYATVSVSLIEEVPREVATDADYQAASKYALPGMEPMPPNPHSPPIRSIQEHPAFKK